MTVYRPSNLGLGWRASKRNAECRTPQSRSPPISPSITSRRSFALASLVFALTFAARWMFMGDSFWVDELHTAWCVSGTWDEIPSRAAAGNQQPLYFQLVWIWNQIPWPSPMADYPIEVRLRLTSLWCISLSAAAIVLGSLRWHGNVIASLAAGLAMTIDRNAAFFGTELRPYAAVVLLTSIALIAASRLWRSAGSEKANSEEENSENENSEYGTRTSDWMALHASVWLAMTMHVTSILTLGWLLLAVTLHDLWRGTTRRVSHGIAAFAWGGILLNLKVTQQNVWENRSAWESFGTPAAMMDLWKMWPWLAWLILPGVVWIASTFFARPTDMQTKSRTFVVPLAGALIASVLAAFVLSTWLGVPVWVRRFLIAGLPIGCWLLGGMIAMIPGETWSRSRTAIVALACLAALAYSQGSIDRRVTNGWVRRGEDWRSASQWLATNVSPGDVVVVDANLIEQPDDPGPVDDADLARYLVFPLAGSYRVPGPLKLVAVGARGAAAESDWCVSRYRRATLPAGATAKSVRRFGAIYVTQFENAKQNP